MEKKEVQKVIKFELGCFLRDFGFTVRALIIAKLAANPDFDHLADRYYQASTKAGNVDTDDGPRWVSR